MIGSHHRLDLIRKVDQWTERWEVNERAGLLVENDAILSAVPSWTRMKKGGPYSRMRAATVFGWRRWLNAKTIDARGSNPSGCWIFKKILILFNLFIFFSPFFWKTKNANKILDDGERGLGLWKRWKLIFLVLIPIW